MIEVIGIRYDDGESLSYVLPSQKVHKNDRVVVRLSKGMRLATVVQENHKRPANTLPAQMDKAVRLADDADLKRSEENMALAKESRSKVKDLIAKHNLQMKLVQIIFSLDRSHVFITYTAEKRVDFRQLLRELAGYFRARIELRQISPREEAKVYGGLGPCGRPLCCSTFLGDFPPVSIKMVKNQNLSLSSGKNTGLCGRLLCCLSYEDDFYREAKQKFPDYGSKVKTQEGWGTVAGMDVFKETVNIRFEEQAGILTYSLEEISQYG